MSTKAEVIQAANARLSYLLGREQLDWVGSRNKCHALMEVFGCKPRLDGPYSAHFVGCIDEDALVRLNIVEDAIKCQERTLRDEADLFDVVNALPDTCLAVVQ